MTERARLMYEYHTRARIAANPIPVCTGMPFFYWREKMHHIMSAVIMLAAGIFLVAKGGDRFVDAASWIARAAGIPAFIIGATIVSVATTLPEMTVSIMAALEGSTELAVGNAVGSVTANTGLILGIAFLFMHVTIRRNDYLVQSLLLIFSAAVICWGCQGGFLSIPAAILLIISFLIFVYRNLSAGRKHMHNHHEATEKVDTSGKNIARNLLCFLLGAAAILIGSRLMVDGGISLAQQLGIPERIIGVTIVAVGTSIPELVTTLAAIRKNEHDLSAGNIIGANILDLSLILPLCSLASGKPLPVAPSAITFDLPACLLITLIGILPLLIREKAGKVQGIFLLASYAAYLAVIL